MPRILSEHGNVIAADFRPRASIDIQVTSEILYCDHLVCLVRYRLVFNGEVISTDHVTAQVQQHG